MSDLSRLRASPVVVPKAEAIVPGRLGHTLEAALMEKFDEVEARRDTAGHLEPPAASAAHSSDRASQADPDRKIMTCGAPAIDGATFRRVLGHYPTGVCVITATEPEGGAAAMIVGSFTSVSLDPPLVAFFPDKGSTSWPRIERAGRFRANILASNQCGLCRAFAAKGGDKFAGVSRRLSANGSPVIDDVVAWIDCALHAVHEAGDHFFVLGRVVALDVARADQPLLFFRGQYGDSTPMLCAG